MAKGDEFQKSSALFRSVNFKNAFIFTFATLIVFLIAFASPYWLQTYHSVPLDFRNMGLWEVCFSKYYFREDTFARIFEGCYWLFSLELDHLKTIFMPGFFIMVQIFCIVVLALLGVATLIMLLILLKCTATHNWTYWILSTALAGLMAISGTLLFVIVVTVGAKSGDRIWMPRADLIWLSWGYAFAVLASVLAFISAFFYGREAKIYWGSKAPEVMLFGMPLFRQGDAGIDPPESGSVY